MEIHPPLSSLIRSALLFLLCMQAAWSAVPGNVQNQSLTADLGEPSGFALTRKVSIESGVIALDPGATEGIAASSAIEAPSPATHLGISWSEDPGNGALGLAVRTSRDGAAWSEWIDVVPDEHMTDFEAKVYYSRLITVPAGYRYVEYSVGLARTQADSASPKLESLNLSFIDAGVSAPDRPQQVVTDEPEMLSRTEWGCPDGEVSSNNPDPTYTDVTHLIVHHTATSNSATDWAAEVRAIWSYHVETRGWADIGYNFLVDPNGVTYVGRAGGDNVQGAHFTCQNGGTQGISLLGDFTNVAPSDEALNSLEDLLAWLASRDGLDPAAISWHAGTQLDLPVVAGHRDGNPSTTGCTVTACPGDTFYPMLPGVRVNVESLIAAAQIPDPVIEDQMSEVVAVFTGDPDASANCHGLFEINGEVIANLHTAEGGCRPYRIDDNGQHVLLADIDTTPRAHAPAGFGTSPPFNGAYYFEGSDAGGNGFWRTGGTTAERVVTLGDWPEGGVLAGRGLMNGRLYFTVRDALGVQSLFSTDGQEARNEPIFGGASGNGADLVGSLLDTLLFVGTDPEHGSEPRVFDGVTYSLLQDIAPGAEGSNPRLFLPLDDHVLFAADLPGSGTGFFRTDGENVQEIPLSGTLTLAPDPADPAVKAHGAYYLAEDIAPAAIDPPGAATGIVRLNGDGATAYELANSNADIHSPTAAAPGDKALAFVENRFFRLGAESAEELAYNFPTDQAGADFALIGSSPYFPFAWVQETLWGEDSQVWSWSENEMGLLLAGEGNAVTGADHFRHIGEDIWFYGEDAVNGRALRRIPGVVQAQTPWMGAVTGAWYDPATDGQGFVLHPIDNTRSVVSFYGYENDGTQLWLLGTAEAAIEAGVESEITMHVSSGGNFGDFTPGQVSTNPWGTLRMNFLTCRDATAELDGLTGRQTMSMVRLAGLAGLECKAPTPPIPQLSGVTGTWFDPATSGQGFVLHAIDETRILVSFYGYRGDSARLWLLGVYDGLPEFDEPLVTEMTLAEGGVFGDFEPADISRTAWGTLTVDFHDCGRATAVLDGIDGQQTMNLVKLAGLDGSERACAESGAEASALD